MAEPFKEATLPSSLHQTWNAGWPQGDEDWLMPPSQNGYLTVRLPHVAGSQSARARSWNRSKKTKSRGSIEAGCMLTDEEGIWPGVAAGVQDRVLVVICAFAIRVRK